MTTLNDTQKAAVRSWLQEGLQLAEIQKRLAAEFEVRLTYMELKLLVSELAVLPKDLEQPKAVELPAAPAAGAAGAPAASPPPPARPLPPPPAPAPPPGGARVSVAVDQIARPGALASGTVRFSDGKQGGWYLDETGRLGLVAPEPGYRPPAADVQEFQVALERELAKIGF